jgi:hypothetical protein
MSRTLVAQGEHIHNLPFPALVFGLLAFLMLCAMLVAVLMFGKGRPHS